MQLVSGKKLGIERRAKECALVSATGGFAQPPQLSVTVLYVEVPRQGSALFVPFSQEAGLVRFQFALLSSEFLMACLVVFPLPGEFPSESPIVQQHLW